MKRINVTPYRCHLDQIGEDGKPTGQKLEIQVLPSLVSLLFATQCPPRELLKRSELADRLDAHTGDTVTLEDHQWEWLTKALDAVQMQERQFAELIRRVLDAETVSALAPVPVSEDPAHVSHD